MRVRSRCDWRWLRPLQPPPPKRHDRPDLGAVADQRFPQASARIARLNLTLGIAPLPGRPHPGHHGSPRRTNYRTENIHGLQFALVPDLLRGCTGPAQPAVLVDGEEGQPAGRELPVLCGLEPTVRPPADL